MVFQGIKKHPPTSRSISQIYIRDHMVAEITDVNIQKEFVETLNGVLTFSVEPYGNRIN